MKNMIKGIYLLQRNNFEIQYAIERFHVTTVLFDFKIRRANVWRILLTTKLN